MKFIKEAIYYVIDFKIIVFLVSILIASSISVFSPDENIYRSTKLILSSAASVGFTLFDFAVTALLILATLKVTPFAQKVEDNNKIIFRKITDYFMLTAIFLFIFGLIGLTVSPDFIPKAENYNSISNKEGISIRFGIWVIILLTIIPLFLSINCLALLRLLVLGNSEDE